MSGFSCQARGILYARDARPPDEQSALGGEKKKKNGDGEKEAPGGWDISARS